MNYRENRIIGLAAFFALSVGYADDDCCDDGSLPSYECEDGSIVCDADECPPCSEDNPDPSSSAKVCCDGEEVTLAPSVSYGGAASLWKGDDATWTVSGGCVDDFSVSGTGFTISGSTISYTASDSSANSTEQKKPSVFYDGESVNVDEGPVVYEVVSADFDKDSICEGETATIEVQYSPSGGTPPVLTWSGTPITAAGALPSGHSLSVGEHSFQAEANETVSASVIVVSSTVYTRVHTAQDPSPNLANDPYNNVTIPGSPMIPSVTVSGHFKYSDSLEVGENFEPTDCSGTLSSSKHKTHSIGLSGGYTFYGVTISGGVSYDSSVSYTRDWQEDDRRLTVQTVIPTRRVDMIVTNQDGNTVSPWTLDYWVYAYNSKDANVDAQCCEPVEG